MEDGIQLFLEVGIFFFYPILLLLFILFLSVEQLMGKQFYPPTMSHLSASGTSECGGGGEGGGGEGGGGGGL